MKRFYFLLTLFIILQSCQNPIHNRTAIETLIPNEAEAILKINSLGDFNASIKTNPLFKTLNNKELKTTSQFVKHLKPNSPIYIALTKEKDNNTSYVILTKNNLDVFVTNSIPNHKSERLPNLSITKTQIDTTVIYHKILNNVFTYSNNLDLLKALSPKNENKELSKLIKTTNTTSIASLIFKTNHKVFSKLLFSNFKTKSNVSNYTVLDIDLDHKTLKYNGIITANDSIKNSLDSFKKTIAQKTHSLTISPSTTESLLSISFDDFSIFNKNLNQLKGNQQDSTTTFLNDANEIALLENTVLIHSLDADLTLASISEKTPIETFRGIKLYEYGNPDFFKTRLSPFITFKDAKILAVYKEFILFSNSIKAIKSIISDALNNNTLSNSEAFIAIQEDLSNEASLFIFKNDVGLSKTLKSNTAGHKANAVQYTYENNYAHVNGIIQKYKKKAASNTITESFTTALEAEVLTQPQTLKNHITKSLDIAVQDINNTLYLISNSGNILWKKSLKSKIIGQIKQIDINKNGRLQLVFNTDTQLFVIDRNGKNVSNFPLTFKDEITQPVAVFDYDNNKNYRLLITQRENLLMYSSKGKIIKGFNYSSNGAAIKSEPKHFRIGYKDYICFKAGKNLKILNRKGQVRIPVKAKIEFSNNDLYVYQNKFTTSNTLGDLIQINTKGKRNTKNLNLTNNHNIVATSKTLVTLDENKLNIKTRKIDLDYGDYTKPQIFYLNNKIYVSVTDLQTKKIYLFDSQAKSISNFPIYGATAAVLCNLDKDKSLELVTLSDEKTLVTYQLN